MDAKRRKVNKLPKPYTNDAAPRKDDNFHFKTRDACASGNTANIGLKICKAIVLGDVAVGKTSLINRFCRNAFDHDYKATIGVDFEVERFQILDQEFNMQIWDTAGQERFKCMAAAYYRAAHVIILVFDLTRTRSLENTRMWLDEALESNPSNYPEIFIVGTKMDLCKSSDLDQMESKAIEAAQGFNGEYWSVSSKTGENVAEFFSRMASIAFEQALLRGLETQERRQQETRQIGGQIGGGFGGGVVHIRKRKEEEEKKSKMNCCAGGR